MGTSVLSHSITDEATQRSVRLLEKKLNEATARLDALAARNGVAVDITEVHAALVALGLITL